VSPRRTLERRIALWFAATLVVLYGVVAAGLWGTTRQRKRDYAMLTLKTEAEAVATYVAAIGRTDAPEILEAETEPFPIWIRLIDDREIVAATPGAPDVPAASPEATDEALYLRPPGADKPMLVVRHTIGGQGRELAVEAIGDIASLRVEEHRLGLGLAVLGLVIIPFAATGGRLLAARALAPLGELVRDIGSIDPSTAGQRLAPPAGSVEEVAVLAEAFNDVLGRLERTLHTMRRFTADASHEIRNPLAVLRTGLEVTLRRERDVAAYQEVLRESLDEILRLQSILDGLLTLARAEPESTVLAGFRRFDLVAAVRETVRRFAIVLEETGSRIEVDAPESLELRGEPQLLRLVVFNLIDNALKHGPAGQTVSVAVREAGDGAELEVTDEGSGVAAEHRPYIFERYYRPADGPDGSNVGGLGLSVVRWVTEVHRGQVRLVETERGARFRVRLPRTAFEEAADDVAV